MNIKKIYYLILLCLNQNTHTSDNHRYIIIDNQTNLPLIVEQTGHKVCLCRPFTKITVPILKNKILDCFLRKRKHRMDCIPIKILPTDLDSKIIFYRENNYIIGERVEYDDDASSVELE